jgi:hypothetical protein
MLMFSSPALTGEHPSALSTFLLGFEYINGERRETFSSAQAGRQR